jgi:hypothetical protein
MDGEPVRSAPLQRCRERVIGVNLPPKSGLVIIRILAPYPATLVSLSLPATAGQKTVTGPKGGTATGSGAIVPNRQGGYSGTGQGSFQGANGASGSAQGQFKSNGQGTVNYQGSGTVTTPQGTTYNATTNGNGSYDEENGYSGQNTTTVNGNTYSSNTP